MEAFSIEDQSTINARTQQLSDQHRKYFEDHPELTQLLHDFLTNCLVNKPEDPFLFCREYFNALKGGDGVGDVTVGWEHKQKCRALIITGPTGAGKHFAARSLARLHAWHFGVAVSHTTRKPREGEKDGLDYVFVNQEAFSIAMRAGEFVCVCEVNGDLYGTKRERVDTIVKSGRVCIFTCDLKGATAMRKALAGELMPRVLYFKPEIKSLEARLGAVVQLEKEATYTAEQRVAQAEKEYEEVFAKPKGLFDKIFEVQFDSDEPLEVSRERLDELFKWIFDQDWKVIVNDDLSRAATKIQGQARRKRDAKKVEGIKEEQKALTRIAP